MWKTEVDEQICVTSEVVLQYHRSQSSCVYELEEVLAVGGGNIAVKWRWASGGEMRVEAEFWHIGGGDLTKGGIVGFEKGGGI